jgi:hypothetical protein
MAAMENRPGVAKMRKRMRKIAKVIMEGLALSARATAWREGLPWEPSAGRDAADAAQRRQRIL